MKKEDLNFIYMALGTFILVAVFILLILAFLDFGREYMDWLDRTKFIK